MSSHPVTQDREHPDAPSRMIRPVARIDTDRTRSLEVVPVIHFTKHSPNKRFTFTLQDGAVTLVERAVETRNGWRGPWATYPGRVPESVREALVVELGADTWGDVLAEQSDHEWLEGVL